MLVAVFSEQNDQIDSQSTKIADNVLLDAWLQLMIYFHYQLI